MNRFVFVLAVALGTAAFGQNGSPPPAAPAGGPVEIQKWLTTVDAQWQPIFARDVTAAYEAEISKVRQQYLNTLEGNMAKASLAGNLDLTLLWKKERERFLATKDMPAEDDAADPAELKAARAVCRTQAARTDKERLGRARSVFDRYDQILGKAQMQLTQRQRFDDALAVKARREEIAKAWLGGTGETSLAKTNSHDTAGKPMAAASGELTIIAATYGEAAGGRRSEDITSHIKKIFESGQPTLKLSTKFGADGKDPAPTKLKQTTITYKIGGEEKKKTFPESYDLDFKRDLN